MIPFWKTKKSSTAKEFFHGNVMGSMNKSESGDYILTQKGDVFKFKYGVNGVHKYPILQWVEKIKISKFPDDDTISVHSKMWQPLGEAVIYQLSNNEFYWEY